MSALKWKNVDLKLGIIKAGEIRVRGIEERSKAKKSVRGIMMPPHVVEALRDQRKFSMGNCLAGFNRRWVAKLFR